MKITVELFFPIENDAQSLKSIDSVILLRNEFSNILAKFKTFTKI